MLNSFSKGLQVFISSTFVDLKAEHSAAIAAILSCGHQPAGAGQFQIPGEQLFPRPIIEQWIDQSDVYVLILGHRYGDLEPEMDKSDVHFEYDYAVAQGMPVIACLIAGDQEPQAAGETAESIDRLLQFRQQVQAHDPHYWHETLDLKQGLVARLSELPQPLPDLSVVQPSHGNQTEALSVILLTLQTCTQSIHDATAATQEAYHLAEQSLTMAISSTASVQETVADLTQIQAAVAEGARTAKRLGESAQQMSKVMKLVNQLVSRTNVIALNASIEVSRMGTRGAEFTTVANDLRQLANHTAKIGTAVEQIVQPMQKKTNLVVTALAEGVQVAIATTQPATQTRAALEQLSQALKQLNQNMQLIVQSTAEQTAASTCMTEILQSLDVGFDIQNDSTP
ncbi:Methyl-accepting chemotaxis protein McpH [Acaryochloris thomasi RCC1774]|uniref:Methyl-accepting chemotaxis protein McpH n=1 Tax=Acaryochloris thomasi RCC1774 TaxID=1764569 RepID=A0A2W1JRZ3_9CYAN|nr:DUF4062 domain-containing protein [Acaryochloris thomasi]PZD73472.1 Methyl-accepting chemotaxis protein McpH [Acaryochloris thomasi RCC1774]